MFGDAVRRRILCFTDHSYGANPSANDNGDSMVKNFIVINSVILLGIVKATKDIEGIIQMKCAVL